MKLFIGVDVSFIKLVVTKVLFEFWDKSDFEISKLIVSLFLRKYVIEGKEFRSITWLEEEENKELYEVLGGIEVGVFIGSRWNRCV